jgi:drug/metabolite transporter (DMT)-like permease
MTVDEHTRRQRLAVFLGLLGVIVFGLTMPATRAAVLELDPVSITLGRALLAAFLAAVTLAIARPQPPLRRDWGRLFWFAVCSIVGFPLLMTTAMQYAPASHAAVVLAVLPLLTAMAGVLVARERPSPAFWACGVAGTVVVLIYALLSGGGSGDLHWADLLLAAAALAAATAYALGGEMSHRIGDGR